MIIRFVVALLFLFTGSALAFSITPPGKITNAPSDGRYDIPFNILVDIEKAKKLLATREAGYELTTRTVWVKGKGEKGKWTKRKITKLADFDVLIAVEHISERNIKVIRLNKNSGEFTPGYTLDWEKFNGVNTNFIVSHPKGHIVLAIKRVVNEKKGFREVVYTPFSADLDLPFLRRRGWKYLHEKLEGAKVGLRERGVKSKSFPKELVSDIVPMDVAFKLVQIEHIDPARIKDEPIEALMNEVLVVIAANRGDAYRYSVSTAKARGLFQFIPRTYNSMYRKYPSAKLNKNFVAGMNDHLNAAEASLLLFDSDISALEKAERGQLRKNPKLMAQYLAAAYNGGSGRAKKALSKNGLTTSHLLPETIIYVKKLELVEKIIR